MLKTSPPAALHRVLRPLHAGAPHRHAAFCGAFCRIFFFFSLLPCFCSLLVVLLVVVVAFVCCLFVVVVDVVVVVVGLVGVGG